MKYLQCIDCMCPIRHGEIVYDTLAGPIHRHCALEELPVVGKTIAQKMFELPTFSDYPEIKREEEIEVVLFEYEDENVAFDISYEFVFSKKEQVGIKK